MTEEIIKAGTILTIDSEFVEKVKDSIDKGMISTRDYEQWCWGMDEEWLPRDIVFDVFRINRRFLTLGWTFLDADLASQPNHNMTIFRVLGYDIKWPDQVELDVCNCPDKFLTAKELVQKQLILNNPSKTRVWSYETLMYVTQAMEAKGVVFYLP